MNCLKPSGDGDTMGVKLGNLVREKVAGSGNS
jgi:hypothetical protein